MAAASQTAPEVMPWDACWGWSIQQIHRFLELINLIQYCAPVSELGIDGKILSELVRLNGLDGLGVTNIVHKAKIVGHLRRIADESAGAASTASGISADAPSSAGSRRLRKSMMKCLCLFCFACLIARSVCLFDYLFVFVLSSLF